MKLLISVLLLLSAQHTLRVDVSLVTVGVRVTDARGRDVRGLKVEDFSVFEDGATQKIAFFSSEPQPITLGILVDRSSSMDSNNKMERAKDAARALLGGGGEESEFFYIEFDDKVNLAADSTADRRQVAAAIQQTVSRGGTSLYDAVLAGLAQAGRARLPRQALAVISDGADEHSSHQLEEIIRIVRESQIQIYTIGYFSKEEDNLFRISGSRMALTNGDAVDNPRLALEKIAEESGAQSFFPRSDEELARAVAEINQELKTQYTVAFYPQSLDPENRYHSLRVAVQGGRYKVRARPGYGILDFGSGTVRQPVSRGFETKVERRDRRLFYRDDFRDPSSGWPQRSTAAYTRDGYRLAGPSNVVTNGPVFGNFHAVVSLALNEPPPEPNPLPGIGTQLPNGALNSPALGGGLIFRYTNQGYYAVVVFPSNGSRPGFAVAFRREGAKSTEMARWSLLNRPARERKIEVRCHDRSCDVLEGGVRLGQLKNLAFSEGLVGLLVSGNGAALFHDVTVEEIE